MARSNRNRKQKTSRRNVLKAAGGCGMMANTSMLATLMNLQATNALASGNSGTGGYKALVCLFMFGGNDGFNMLLPNEGDVNSGEFADYVTARGGIRGVDGNTGGLALAQDTLLDIDGGNGRAFGVHPSMPEVQSLYNQGKLAFVSNVGSLNRWITRDEYNANSFEARPLGLFSHADHQRHWMTSVPNTRSQIVGWGGKMADLLTSSTNGNQFVSMNISTAGVNLFQAGDSVVPYSISLGDSAGNNPAIDVDDYSAIASQGSNLNRRIYSRVADSVLDQTYSNLLAQSLANTNRGSIDAAIDFNNAVNNVNLTTTFATDTLSRRMQVIAKVIGAQSTLQQQRQVFFVSQGGFDNHANLMTAHGPNLERISRAVGSFNEAMVELGLDDEVTLFTASDFARTLGTNGQGSDHAWGSNHFVCGGCVDGGKVYGEYPTSLLNPVDTGDASINRPAVGNMNLGRGRMIPTMSVDTISAELAMWFGISNSELPTILPQIREFYGASETASPLNMFL